MAVTRETCVGPYKFNFNRLTPEVQDLYFNYVGEYVRNHNPNWETLLIALQELFVASKSDWEQYLEDMYVMEEERRDSEYETHWMYAGAF